MLDKGIVIAGDIQINLLDIELLTIKLRLLIASVDKAKELGIDWWESDASLSGQARRPPAGERDAEGTSGAPRGARRTDAGRRVRMSLDPEQLPGDADRTLDRLADEDAARVLARHARTRRARPEALEEALVARLLARTGIPGASDVRERRTRAPAARTDSISRPVDDGEALYLYGVVSADELPTTTSRRSDSRAARSKR